MDSDRVHTLADLDNWRFEGTPLAVLGHPVAHSLSPAMHNAALAELAREDSRFASWRYFKFDIDPADLAGALPRFDECGFAGLNLTVPHKVIAVDLVREIDPAAAEAGAVNTLRRVDRGYAGHNTDGYGITTAIRDELGVTVTGSPVVLLGAGGAGRGAAVACLREGCSGLWIGNRTPANLRRILNDLRRVIDDTGVPVAPFNPADPPAGIPPGSIVINATSSGLKPDDEPPIDLTRLPADILVYDMVYNPPETSLLRAARKRGLRAANGIAMLVHQGARSLEIWTGRPVPAAVMRSALAGA